MAGDWKDGTFCRILQRQFRLQPDQIAACARSQQPDPCPAQPVACLTAVCPCLPLSTCSCAVVVRASAEESRRAVLGGLMAGVVALTASSAQALDLYDDRKARAVSRGGCLYSGGCRKPAGRSTPHSIPASRELGCLRGSVGSAVPACALLCCHQPAPRSD